ncbi:MAG TPA: glycogen synthase GlgA [Terriglobia bacterium]|nr:glycogen synthase GlgA [Terriglobia bacterium]
MRVVMIAAEAAPYAKVGGLADVLGALPPQLAKLGISVSIIIPRYRVIDLRRFDFEPYPVPDNLNFDIHSATIPNSSVRVFLIGNDHYFDRDGIYLDSTTGLDYSDQADRWIFFQRAALEFIRAELSPVDIVHCHDYQAGLIPGYLRRLDSSHKEFSQTKTVFTIHNMGYQGLFPREVMTRTGFDDTEFQPMSPFEFFGQINFLKIGVSFADLVTTVSPTYAREIQEDDAMSFGLGGVLRSRPQPVLGILNGIDYEVWNPETDSLIPANFNRRWYGGLVDKDSNKLALLQAFGLDESRMRKPLLSMLSRIDVQKGFDLVVPLLDELLGLDISFILLGMGNREVESRLTEIVGRHRDRAGIRLGYDDKLSHLIVAGSDIFLMPSRYEPCGLTQMYSMRYGTVPVVRATGGLADTVQEFDLRSGNGTGFRFANYDRSEFREAIDRALQVWSDKVVWKAIIKNGMSSDFSWTRSAQRYVAAYTKLLGPI